MSVNILFLEMPVKDVLFHEKTFVSLSVSLFVISKPCIKITAVLCSSIVIKCCHTNRTRQCKCLLNLSLIKHIMYMDGEVAYSDIYPHEHCITFVTV